MLSMTHLGGSANSALGSTNTALVKMLACKAACYPVIIAALPFLGVSHGVVGVFPSRHYGLGRRVN